MLKVTAREPDESWPTPTYIHTYIQTDIHATYTHTHTHTHTHIHIHIQSVKKVVTTFKGIK
jgi:hypothetical protein